MAIKLNPNFAVAYFGCANALGKLRKYENAIEKYKIATKLNSNYSEAYNN